MCWIMSWMRTSKKQIKGTMVNWEKLQPIKTNSLTVPEGKNVIWYVKVENGCRLKFRSYHCGIPPYKYAVKAFSLFILSHTFLSLNFHPRKNFPGKLPSFLQSEIFCFDDEEIRILCGFRCRGLCYCNLCAVLFGFPLQFKDSTFSRCKNWAEILVFTFLFFFFLSFFYLK